MRKPFFILLCLLSVLSCKATSTEQAKPDKDVYIVYLGEKEHDDVERITNLHLDMLAQVVGSKEEASKAMVYSYKHGFSGFSAKLTESQAKELEDLPNAVHVTRSDSYKMHTTRSFDYMGLNTNTPNNLLQKTNMGDGIIIGIIDTGIWPESIAFGDESLGPIPPKWKGKCMSGDGFDAEKHCRKKIIGAYWYKQGLEAAGMVPDPDDYMSTRDGSVDGHGTHVASVVAGSYVSDVSYKELGKGTARGAAPNARLAIYKACWKCNGFPTCMASDILAAFEQAVKDGVDVILAAYGRNNFPFDYIPFSIVTKYNGVSVGSFLATSNGIPVVSSAGNSGPQAYTVSNTEAWILTVGSTTMDRSFVTPITLGDGTTYLGEAFQTVESKGFIELAMPNSACKTYWGEGPESRIDYSGKAVLCFCGSFHMGIELAAANLKNQSAAGLIYARQTNDILYRPNLDDFFVVEVDYEIATQIYKYIISTKLPMVKVDVSRTLEGKAVPTKVASFSGRGPITSSDLAPAIVKPDLVAPGANVIGAAPIHTDQYNGFTVVSGTSVSAAHVAGIVGLLRAIHPDWSPAALKSALMTTARSEENGFPLRAGGCPLKPANPFDMGSGVVNPNQAADPGLVYDMTKSDYVDYLCAMGFDGAEVDTFVNAQNTCSNDFEKRPNLVDMNLPSIAIPSLANSITLTRTVTNVGPIDSVYKAEIDHPMGTKVSVNPQELVFDAVTKKITFTVTFSVTKPTTMEFTYGSLVWTDGSHDVRIPIAVKVESFKSTCAVGISC